MMEQKKKKEENLKNNLVFCIERRKTFFIKSVQKSILRNSSQRGKYVYFLFHFFDFDKTDRVSEQFRMKK